jgi:hypothetical protein
MSTGPRVLEGPNLQNRYPGSELDWYDLVVVHEVSRVPPTSGR